MFAVLDLIWGVFEVFLGIMWLTAWLFSAVGSMLVLAIGGALVTAISAILPTSKAGARTAYSSTSARRSPSGRESLQGLANVVLIGAPVVYGMHHHGWVRTAFCGIAIGIWLLLLWRKYAS